MSGPTSVSGQPARCPLCLGVGNPSLMHPIDADRYPWLREIYHNITLQPVPYFLDRRLSCTSVLVAFHVIIIVNLTLPASQFRPCVNPCCVPRALSSVMGPDTEEEGGDCPPFFS